MTSMNIAFRAAAKVSSLAQTFEEITRAKGWTFARKWSNEAKREAAAAYKAGNVTPWTQGHLAGLW